MKNILFKKPGFSTLKFQGRMTNRFVRILSFFLVAAMLNLSQGCNYFKVIRSPAPVAQDRIDQLNYAGKTFILHFGNKKWMLKDLVLQNDSISGRLENYKFPPTYREVKVGKPNRYVVKNYNDQRYLLNEVHLYLNEYADTGRDWVKFPVSAVDKVDVYDRDTATTVGSWFLAITGAVGLAYLSMAIIVLIFKESCPFIYTWDGDNYQFAGEIYSGTIHKPLERHDYMKLPVYSGQDKYRLKMTNEVREVQHTNLLELMVVDHPKGSEAWVDKYGNVKLLGNPVAPEKAENLAGEVVTGLLAGKDHLFYQSRPSDQDIPDRDGIVLEFPLPKGTPKAALAVRAKNSILLDYMLGEFNHLFGDSYHAFMKRKQKASAEKLFQWPMDQGIPLSLSVERYGKWEYVDYYNVAGPMAFKEDILEIPLTGGESDPLRVKLEYGYFFWEIDYTALGIPLENQNVTTVLPAAEAVNEVGEDISGMLKTDDKQYYIQPETENFAEITFSLPQPSSGERSLFLHSKGWYEILIDPQGKPDWKYIKAFREPGRFNQFVAEKFLQVGQLAGKP